jgi:hypothetical protein
MVPGYAGHGVWLVEPVLSSLAKEDCVVLRMKFIAYYEKRRNLLLLGGKTQFLS